MRTPPLLADFIHARSCKPKCEKLLTLPKEECDTFSLERVAAICDCKHESEKMKKIKKTLLTLIACCALSALLPGVLHVSTAT